MQYTGNYVRAEWAADAIIYEVNIRQYTTEGTFDAFRAELVRIRELGVDTLWFMPITPIAQLHKKGSMGSPYACCDYTAINPEFGNLEDFKQLIDAAHTLKFKVIIDWVANHTGWDHVWTKTNPEFYKFDASTGTFQVASGMDDIIELNYDHPEMREAMIAAMKFWIQECNIDGFRCDLASWVTVSFWHEARTALQHLKPLFWLAEMDPIENPDYMQVFDAAYTWKWMHATEDFYKKNRSVPPLRDLLHQYDNIAEGNSLNLWFTSNHDENSWNGTEYEKYGELAHALAVHSFTWSGIPMIYSGQEMPNHKRLPFFEKGAIEWCGFFLVSDFYKKLSHLRKTHPALSARCDQPNTELLYDLNADPVIAYLRKHNEAAVLVLLNFSGLVQRFTIPKGIDLHEYSNLFDTSSKEEHSGGDYIFLKAWEFRCFVKP